MLKSYLLTAIRNLHRNRVFAFINVSGLSIGIGASLVIFLIVRYEFSFDKFHPDPGSIYRVVANEVTAGGEHSGAAIPLPMIDVVKKEVTGIWSTVPMIICDNGLEAIVPGTGAAGAKPARFTKESGGVFTENSYFEMTPYTWLAGSARTALTGQGQAVLTAAQAAEYFPGVAPRNVIGRTIVYFDSIPITVTGIVADLRENSDFTFTQFISLPTLSDSRLAGVYPLHSWGARSSYYELLVRLDKGVPASDVERQLQDIIHQKDPSANEGHSKLEFQLEPLREWHLSDKYQPFGNSSRIGMGALYGFLLLGIVLLGLASINFINLTTAQATQRAKEIGIRKTIGGSRTQLILQFLSETFVITIAATLVSILFLPLLLRVFAPVIPPDLHIDWRQQPGLLAFLAVLVVAVSLLSGFYPAMVLSAFRPVGVLRGQLWAGSGRTQKSLLRRFLSISQFVIAQLFLLFSLGLGWQIRSMFRENQGFRKEAVISIELPAAGADSAGRLDRVLASRVEQLAGVEGISLSAEPPCSNSFSAGTYTYPNGRAEVETGVQLKFADSNYLRLYRIPLLAGRNIGPSDTSREFIINETYARML